MEGQGHRVEDRGGREGQVGQVTDGAPVVGWANLARTSRMRRWTSWAADVADGALATGWVNLARASEIRRSTSILMRRASASGVLDDTFTTGRVRGGAEGAGLTLIGAVGKVGGGAGINRAIRGLRSEIRDSEATRLRDEEVARLRARGVARLRACRVARLRARELTG